MWKEKGRKEKKGREKGKGSNDSRHQHHPMIIAIPTTEKGKRNLKIKESGTW